MPKAKSLLESWLLPSLKPLDCASIACRACRLSLAPNAQAGVCERFHAAALTQARVVSESGGRGNGGDGMPECRFSSVALDAYHLPPEGDVNAGA